MVGGGPCGSTRAGKGYMAPPHHPCLFYGAECALNAAKGSDESDVALEDVRAGLRAGLVCGTHPDGTHNETDRDRGQGGEAGRDGIEVGLTSRKWTLLRHKGGVLDQGVEDLDPPFSYRLSHLKESPERTCTGAAGGGE